MTLSMQVWQSRTITDWAGEACICLVCQHARKTMHAVGRGTSTSLWLYAMSKDAKNPLYLSRKTASPTWHVCKHARKQGLGIRGRGHCNIWGIDNFLHRCIWSHWCIHLETLSAHVARWVLYGPSSEEHMAANQPGFDYKDRTHKA